MFSTIILGSGIFASDFVFTKLLSLVPICLQLLSGLFLYLYYRKAHQWSEVFDTSIKCCLFVDFGSPGYSHLLWGLLLACIQFICCPVFFCNWWLKWCDCCGVNGFVWASCLPYTGDTLSNEDLEMDINVVQAIAGTSATTEMQRAPQGLNRRPAGCLE